MQTKDLPALDILEHHFSYESRTGLLRWRAPTSNRVRVGSIAGKLLSDGYVGVTLRGRKLLAHRVAWALHHKAAPPRHLDHRDRARANNRIRNLRRATKKQNGGNSRRPRRNTSGLKGVSYRGERKKFAANIRVNGRLKFLGYFNTAAAAHEAYCAKGRATWGAYFSPG